METTTIQLKREVLQALKKSKEYPRQTYNELIAKMITIVNTLRKRNQYDEFLHLIQQPKMKELWDNTEDEVWEHA